MNPGPTTTATAAAAGMVHHCKANLAIMDLHYAALNERERERERLGARSSLVEGGEDSYLPKW